MQPRQPIIISIDGNIGSGKSTTWMLLKKKLINDKRVVFVEEPVILWESVKDEHGTSVLALFYKDTKKHAFKFQILAYLTRMQLLRKTIQDNPQCEIVISERSVETDMNVFAQLLYDTKDISHDEFEIYKMCCNEFKNYQKPLIVYIRADPEKCMERIISRAREGEVIPIEYLTLCHEYHEKWIQMIESSKKMIIDANESIQITGEEPVERVEMIYQFILSNLPNKA